MPKSGFKSITVNEAAFERWRQVYKKNKFELEQRGIKSLAAYIVDVLDRKLEEQNGQIRFKVILATKTMVVLSDAWTEQNITLRRVILADDHWECDLCNSINCMHVGFISTLWQTYGVI